MGVLEMVDRPETDGVWVPIGEVLGRIENTLNVIRGKLDKKADSARVDSLEARVQDLSAKMIHLESTYVSGEDFNDTLTEIKATRTKFWLTVGLVIFAQVVNVVLFIVAKGI